MLGGGGDLVVDVPMNLKQTYDLTGQLGLSGIESRTARIVAVGDPEQWARSGRRLPRTDRMRFVAFEEVTADLLLETNPEYILSPVVSTEFDCIDLATLLCRLDYRGPYRAVSADIPSPAIIEREIRQLCPNLDFGVINTI